MVPPESPHLSPPPSGTGLHPSSSPRGTDDYGAVLCVYVRVTGRQGQPSCRDARSFLGDTTETVGESALGFDSERWISVLRSLGCGGCCLCVLGQC